MLKSVSNYKWLKKKIEFQKAHDEKDSESQRVIKRGKKFSLTAIPSERERFPLFRKRIAGKKSAKRAYPAIDCTERSSWISALTVSRKVSPNDHLKLSQSREHQREKETERDSDCRIYSPAINRPARLPLVFAKYSVFRCRRERSPWSLVSAAFPRTKTTHTHARARAKVRTSAQTGSSKTVRLNKRYGGKKRERGRKKKQRRSKKRGTERVVRAKNAETREKSEWGAENPCSKR